MQKQLQNSLKKIQQALEKKYRRFKYVQIYFAGFIGFFATIFFMTIGIHGGVAPFLGATLTTFCFYLADQTSIFVKNLVQGEEKDGTGNDSSNRNDSD